MSDGMNRVVLLGNLGADPELRYAGSGTAVLQFRMATNESFLDRNRELTERTEWHNVVVFGPRAEGLARVLGKGSCVLVEGTLRTSSYEKDGQKRYKTEVHARDICLAGGPSPAPHREHAGALRRDADDDIAPVEMSLPQEEPEVPPEPTPPARPPRKRNGAPPRKTEMLEEMPF
ncbi:single-stranded DNA-binding protein [Polyangium mundeleinium]|uniref:Single-stranded DNA-binding protein n=1 Tax=Polyangium mundeleinium TaxID=2995306 RepID=A0ABT5EN21_9BACT|nr:single-stranded DNA-binding protein [Polyangium mundeleinium]MDC0743237.1 single-stranded DNA-binding protein [Polyangium mundeleinium]